MVFAERRFVKKHKMENKYYILELIVRVFTGVIFLFQGYDKLFKVKIQGVIDAFYLEAQKNSVPPGLVKIMAVYTSFVEFLGGLMLILGLYQNAALTLLGIDLVLVAVAFSVMNPVWDMKHVYPRFVLVSALLMFPSTWNYFSLDNLISHLLIK
jgi:putative oxidoreductase